MHYSPPWTRNTKYFIAAVMLVLIGLAVWRFSDILQPLAVATILAYLLHPAIDFFQRRLHMARGLAALIVYLVALILIATVLAIGGLIALEQSRVFVGQIPNLLDQLARVTQEHLQVLTTSGFRVGRLTIHLPSASVTEMLDGLREDALGQIRNMLGQSGILVTGIAQVTFSFLTQAILVIIVSIYLAIDGPRFIRGLTALAEQPGYADDAHHLLNAFMQIWNHYLRGQIILATIMAVNASIAFALLRVPNPLAMGITAGLLEFVPLLGQYVMMSITLLVVLFQPENFLGIPPWLYLLLVASILFLIQQVQGNIILPRVHGSQLALHPAAILVGVVMGVSLFGMLGAVLAAPVLATIKLFGSYIWRKMLNLPPFEPLPEEIIANEIPLPKPQTKGETGQIERPDPRSGEDVLTSYNIHRQA